MDIKLVPLKQCSIDDKLYGMYQDIPPKEIGSSNIYNGLDYNKFVYMINDYDSKEIIKYILYIDNLPIGEIGIKIIFDKYDSQIFYKIRLQERGKGYGNILLSLALEEAKKLGYKEVRVNCNNNNIPSKKVILNNGGVMDIENYKTVEGYSSSYIIKL